MRLAGIASLILLTGCPLVRVSASFEEVRITRSDIHVDGVTETSISRSFAIDDLSEIHELLDFDADLQFVRAELRPTSGVTDLTFIDTASIGFDGTQVYSCDGDCPNLSAIQSSAVDYLAADSIDVSLDVSGQLPTNAWTLDVDVYVKGHVAYEVNP
jgi:hypothetical protein